jgi:hypothetical protein
VEVNSRDRNYTLQTASNPLKFTLARPLKDVRSIEIISGTIPAKPQNVNQYNNKFTFQEGATKWTVEIPPDYYTAEGLLVAVASAINTLPGVQNRYTFSKHTSSHKLLVITTTFSPTPPQFSFLFGSGAFVDDIDRLTGFFTQMNTLAYMLGFDTSDYLSASNSLISPYPVDINTAITRLYVYINFENTQSLGSVERGAGRRTPFAIIYLDQENGGYKFLNKETLTTANYSLPQPYGRLQSLSIEFRDEFYRLINFNGKDFSLLLQLTLLE